MGWLSRLWVRVTRWLEIRMGLLYESPYPPGIEIIPSNDGSGFRPHNYAKLLHEFVEGKVMLVTPSPTAPKARDRPRIRSLIGQAGVDRDQILEIQQLMREDKFPNLLDSASATALLVNGIYDRATNSVYLSEGSPPPGGSGASLARNWRCDLDETIPR